MNPCLALQIKQPCFTWVNAIAYNALDTPILFSDCKTHEVCQVVNPVSRTLINLLKKCPYPLSIHSQLIRGVP